MFHVGLMKRVISLLVVLGMLHVRGVIHHLVCSLVGTVFTIMVPPVHRMVHSLMLQLFILLLAMLLGPVFPVFFTHRPKSFLIA
jgi:hypothetical protein